MDFPQPPNSTNYYSSAKFNGPILKETSPNITRRMSAENPNPAGRGYDSNISSSSSNVCFQPSNQEDEPFKVYVRVRPLDNREQAAVNPKTRLNIVKVEDNMLFVLNPYIGPEWSYKPEKVHVFNKVFDQESKTAEIYNEALSSVIEKVINGYNSTVLAYGMTGAGKTFTMFGDIYNNKGGPDLNPGIISLMVKDLFKVFEQEGEKGFEFGIKFSYLEIYNEHARDLLAPSSEDLMIIEDSQRGIVIPNLSEYVIKSHEEIVKLILQGNQRRVMISTHANQFSSRSHAIIQLVVEKRSKTKNIVDSCLQSKLRLVDLAGSERAAVSENKGLRHREGANINRSLLALGNCINILSDPNKKGAFVPYRDSKLTRLLKESLGGNTQTVMMACVSPSFLAYEETVNTLKYASRARNIQRKLVQNVKEVELHISEYKGIIESLRAEVDSLKYKLSEKNSQGVEQTMQSKQQPSKQTAKVLDELSEKLVHIFEENWEMAQSCNELKELKVQNETILKNKVQSLGKAVGNVELYNKLTEEIAALKEVMVNNEKIEEDMKANLQRSNQEKKAVQTKILEILSQTIQNSDGTYLPDLTQSSKFFSMGDSLEQGASPVPEIKGSRVYGLQKEVEEMRRKLEEKDKLLVQNQEIIQTLMQHNGKLDQPKQKSATPIRLIPNCSPVKVYPNNHESQKSIRQDLSLLDRDLDVSGSKVNEIPMTVQMTSLARINSPQVNQFDIASPKRAGDPPKILFSSQQIATVKLELETTRREYPEESSSLTTIPQEEASIHLRSIDPPFFKEPKSIKVREIIGEMEFPEISGASSLDNIKRSAENSYRNPISVAYTLADQPDGFNKHHPKSVCTPIPMSETKPMTKDELVRVPVTPQTQTQQQLLHHNSSNSSPSLSTIIYSNENSVNVSVKDMLLESLNNARNKKKLAARKDLPVTMTLNGKENLEKIESISYSSSKPTTVAPLAQSYSIVTQKSPPKTRERSNSKKAKVCNVTAVSTSDFSTSANTYPVQCIDSMVSPPAASLLGKKMKTLIPTSCSPKRPVGVRNLNKATGGNGYKTFTQEDKVEKYGIREDLGSSKQFVRDSFSKQKSGDVKGSERKLKAADVSTSLSGSYSGSTHKSFGESRDKQPKYTIVETQVVRRSSEKVKGEVKSMEGRRDIMRDIMREFRTKLHDLAGSVDVAPNESKMNEIANLMNEYRTNSQAYPLTNGDTSALKKLENVLINQSNKSKGVKESEPDNVFANENEKMVKEREVGVGRSNELCDGNAEVPSDKKEQIKDGDSKQHSAEAEPGVSVKKAVVHSSIKHDERRKGSPTMLFILFGGIVLALVLNFIVRVRAN